MVPVMPAGRALAAVLAAAARGGMLVLGLGRPAPRSTARAQARRARGASGARAGRIAHAPPRERRRRAPITPPFRDAPALQLSVENLPAEASGAPCSAVRPA
jgi:hypothetical protein